MLHSAISETILSKQWRADSLTRLQVRHDLASKTYAGSAGSKIRFGQPVILRAGTAKMVWNLMA